MTVALLTTVAIPWKPFEYGMIINRYMSVTI